MPRQLVSEILKMSEDSRVLVRGKIINVLKKPSNRTKGFAIVELKDNTGVIKIRVENIDDCSSSKEILTQNRILNVAGKIIITPKGEKVILGNWKELYSHKSIDKNYQKAEAELKEQQSRSIISKICRVISEKLEEKGYLEISTKVVSREWNEEAFNLMEAIYPGFGTPVYLVPSPFSQLSDFLLATFNDKAFSVTSSFASNYRFPHSPTEMKIVYAVSMAKDNQPLTELMKELHDIVNGKISKLLSPDSFNLPDLAFKTENLNLQVIADNWTSVIKNVIRYQSVDGDVFMEGSEEVTDGEMQIQTMVVYPTQYMGNLNMRQLFNYERFYNESRHPYANESNFC